MKNFRRVVMSLNSKALRIAEGSLTFSRAASADPTTFAPPSPLMASYKIELKNSNRDCKCRGSCKGNIEDVRPPSFRVVAFPRAFKNTDERVPPSRRATSESPRSPIPPMVTPPRTGGTSPA